MLRFVTLFLIVIGTSEARLVLRSPYDLYFFYDYHGSLTSGSHTYEQARMFCEGIGGQLPSYHSEDDINFVLNKLIGDRSKGNHIWSGLYWSDTLNSQVWSMFRLFPIMCD